uniref:Uncharacterized protein n=1 Tax=Cajanus cajan TaxID=3821 RepID=A0A151RQR1_CAJCA|nr:hypothetical protein KK1_033627 [Cajanus cajan]
MLSWKTNSLSFARRMTMIKAIISAMPSYDMQSGKVPRYKCDELGKISRGFFGDDKRALENYILLLGILFANQKIVVVQALEV